MKDFFLHIFILAAFQLSSQTNEMILNSKWEFRQKGSEKWYPGTVPGTVHTDLLDNKLIPDPFTGDNEKKVQWVENEDWEYRTQFLCDETTLKQNNIELKFEGLDTYARVYLNNKLLLDANNMFRSWTVDVKKEVVVGNNSLLIVFESAVKKGKAEAVKLPYTLPGDEKVFTRKAQYQYGWDWGPRLVTCGVWKPIKLITWNKIKLESVYAHTKEIKDSIAKIEFIVETICEREDNYYLNYSYSNKKSPKATSQTKVLSFKPGSTTNTISLEIKNPELWWCNGLNNGNSAIYTASLSIGRYDSVFEKTNVTFGIRTIELIQEKDSSGSSFYFKLNGKPIYIKGANYIPEDNFLTRKKTEKSRELIQLAAYANMNMLRVWGGGAYPDEEFLQKCDMRGIMVWQDLMFACAMYPGDVQFLDNVKKEIAEQVKAFRNHPCLALWCGNNEIDEGWHNWGWQKQYKYSANDSSNIWLDYKRLFHVAIPNTIKQYDLKTPYWPSSPSIGWGRKESLQQGDSHYWGVWWGNEPFETYKNKVGRFMSEYGFQSMPAVSTLKKACNEIELDLHSDCIKNHQKHPTGFETIIKYMERDFIVPKKFDEFVYTSQLLQAKGMRTAIEAHRIARPYCMGTMFWQLNDCWPVTSWSCIDHYGNLKASYFEVRELYQDILISVREQNKNYDIYLVNDRYEDINGELIATVKDFSGKELYTKRYDITLLASSSSVPMSIPVKDLAKFDSSSVYLSCEFKSRYPAKKLFYFTSEKYLKLPVPKINIKKNLTWGEIEISSNFFVKGVALEYKDVIFYPNYFDMEPGKRYIVKVSSMELDIPRIKTTTLNHINK